MKLLFKVFAYILLLPEVELLVWIFIWNQSNNLWFFSGVENKVGVTRDSAILEVERREKPQIEIYPSASQNVIQGGSVLFQCRVLSGIPNPKIGKYLFKIESLQGFKKRLKSIPCTFEST